MLSISPRQPAPDFNSFSIVSIQSPNANNQMQSQLDVNYTDWLNVSPSVVRADEHSTYGSLLGETRQPVSSSSDEVFARSSSLSSTDDSTHSRISTCQEGLKSALSEQSRVEALFWGTSSPVSNHSPNGAQGTLAEDSCTLSSDRYSFCRNLKKGTAAMKPSPSFHISASSTPSLPATPNLFSPFQVSPAKYLIESFVSSVSKKSEKAKINIVDNLLSSDAISESNSSPLEKAASVCASYIPQAKSNVDRSYDTTNFLPPNNSLCSTPAQDSDSEYGDNTLTQKILKPNISGRTPFTSSPLTDFTCSTSHASGSVSKPPERPLKRFKTSLLSVNLTPSCTDAYHFVDYENGEEEGSRYRTRSKLRSLRAEIEAHEKEEDLRVIRGYLKKEEGDKTKLVRPSLDSDASAETVSGNETADFTVIDPNVDCITGTPQPRANPIVSEVRKSLRPRKSTVLPAKERVLSSFTISSERHHTVDQNELSAKSLSTWAKRGEAENATTSTNTDIVFNSSRRTFPPSVTISDHFPLFYRRFPVCSYLEPQLNNLLEASLRPKSIPNGHFNNPRDVYDLYTPRFVKGVGRDKVGLCPICFEPRNRGGAGKAEWLSMKFSAFKVVHSVEQSFTYRVSVSYHMQYAHGISPTTTRPFSPPLAFRIVSRQVNHKNEKTQIMEGHCHKCLCWAPVEGVKCVEAKLKEIYWWKHTSTCHKGSNIIGETEVHIEDNFFRAVQKVVCNI